MSPERRFKALERPVRVLVLILASGLFLGTIARAQSLQTFFTEEDLAAFERLVLTAEQNNLAVLEAQAALGLGQAKLEPLGRLSEALTIQAGAGVSGDIYSQATPSYNISISLDVLALIDVEDKTPILNQRLAAARAQSRVMTVEAFVRYVIARNAAEATARALESAESAFRVVSTRLEVGLATVNDQLSAQTAVSEAAVALLSANGEKIIALETLGATVGLSAEATLAVIRGEG